MAARRERERRRPPAERRYKFGTPEANDVEADDALIDGEGATQDAVATPARRSRPAREVAATGAAAATRSGTRTGSLPFSAFSSEYAYVVSDLRRVGLVIGSLLVILILLYFILPH
jgi:hypothetical protein